MGKCMVEGGGGDLPDRKTTPATAGGTEREMTVAVANPMSSGVTLALEGCFNPGWGNEGLINVPDHIRAGVSKFMNNDAGKQQ